MKQIVKDALILTAITLISGCLLGLVYEITKEPIAGKTVVLTLNKSVQTATQDALESVIRDQQSKGGTVKAGAAVMMNIKTGDNVILLTGKYEEKKEAAPAE